MVLVGQDKAVAAHAQTYITACLPGIYLSGLNDLQSAFLNIMGKSHVPMLCQSTAILFHWVLCYIFVVELGLEVQGIGLATSLSNLVPQVLMLAFVSRDTDLEEARQTPDRRTFSGLGQYMSIGLAAVTMVCLEWWSFEMLVLISGYISVTAQAAHVILITILASITTVGRGLNSAATAVIGKHIGAQNEALAVQYFRVLSALTTITALLFVFLLWTQGDYFFSFFTQEEEVLQQCRKVLGLLTICVVPDIFQLAMQGVGNAIAAQNKIAALNFVAYWVLELPLAAFLIYN